MQTRKKSFAALLLPHFPFLFYHFSSSWRAEESERERGRERERERKEANLCSHQGTIEKFHKTVIGNKTQCFWLPGIRKESGKSTAPKSAILFQTYNLWILTYFRKPTDTQTGGWVGGWVPERGEKGALSKRLTFLAKHRRKKSLGEKKLLWKPETTDPLISDFSQGPLLFFALQLHQASKKRHFFIKCFWENLSKNYIGSLKSTFSNLYYIPAPHWHPLCQETAN